MWQVWPLPSRRLPSPLSLSLCLAVALSLSFLLITSPLFLSFAFHYSIFSSDFYPLALPLPLVSLRLRAVPVLIQLVITKPLTWSLNFPNLEKGRGWRKKMKQQRQTGAGWAITWSGGKRRVSRCGHITTHFPSAAQLSSALSQCLTKLNGNWLKAHHSVIQ